MLLTTAPHPVGLSRHLLLMSHSLDIDQFVIKVNAKKSRLFDLSEVSFKCAYTKPKFSIVILQTVKIGNNVRNAKM